LNELTQCFPAKIRAQPFDKSSHVTSNFEPIPTTTHSSTAVPRTSNREPRSRGEPGAAVRVTLLSALSTTRESLERRVLAWYRCFIPRTTGSVRREPDHSASAHELRVNGHYY
jgi:hypothetical protein